MRHIGSRYLLAIVALLLAGAVLNVAVAWASAYWATSLGSIGSYRVAHRIMHGYVEIDFVEFDSVFRSRYTANATLHVPGAQSYSRFMFRPWFWSGVRDDRESIPPWAVKPDRLISTLYTTVLNAKSYGEIFALNQYTLPNGRWSSAIPVDDELGWPCRSMWGSLEVAVDVDHIVHHGLLLPSHKNLTINGRPADEIAACRALPLGVIPVGFAINSVVYAAACAGLLLLLRHLRSRFRRAACRCVRCNYDLRGQTSPGCPECGAGRGSSTPDPLA